MKGNAEKRFIVLSRTLSSDHTTTFNNHFANHTSINEAVFLAWFLYMWKEKANNGWMFLIEEHFLRRTSISRNGFRQVVKNWEDMGLITTKLQGSPMKKFYSVNVEKLVAYVDSIMEKELIPDVKKKAKKGPRVNPSEIGGLNPSETGRIYNNIKYLKKNKKEKNSPSGRKPPSGGCSKHVSYGGTSDRLIPDTTPPRKLTKYERLAIKYTNILWDEVERIRQLDPKCKKYQWIDKFHKFLKSKKATIKEFKDTLDWYLPRMTNKGIPEAFSAEAFCTKFLAIKIKMVKDRNSYPDRQPNQQVPVICPEAELTPENLCSSGTECHFCGRSDRKVWYVFAPGTCDMTNICKKCHGIEEEKNSVG